MINDLIKKFTNEIMDKYKNKIHKIILFGSYARGDYKDNSDVDLLIVWQENRNCGAEKIEDIAYEYLLEKGVYFSIKVLTIKQYNDLRYKGSPFIKNIEEEGLFLENDEHYC